MYLSEFSRETGQIGRMRERDLKELAHGIVEGWQV